MIGRWIRKFLGLKDTHYMTCQEMRIFGELIVVSDPCSVSAGDKIEINGVYFVVECHVLRVTKL